MLSKIDWLSFTIDLGQTEHKRDANHMVDEIMTVLDFIAPQLFFWLGMDGDNAPTKARAPYSMAWRWVTRSLTVYCHPNLQHVLFEISGQGCDLLDADGTFPDVLTFALPRITRLDVATDILTETRPIDFYAMRDVGRFKTHSELISPSGETCYVGSQTSDRHCRVYRYNAPHERSHLLRVEVVLRSKTAQIAAAGILQRGLPYVAASLGNVFGWTHEDWRPSQPEADTLRAYRPDRHNGKTEYWLASQVKPTLMRLHRTGALDVLKWFDANIREELQHGTS